jgi:hypothetical protein
MKKICLVSILFCIITFSTFAQSKQVYAFQKDDTVLRKKYWDESVKKKELFLSEVVKEYKSDYKKIYDGQFSDVDSLWETTRSVTSREANNYIQSVVAKIISVNNELKQTDARVVFSRDWWPNAYSLGDGSIAVNAGLMIYLDNEAELAFVISHELAHYYLQHRPKAIKKYIETINSEEYKKELKRLSKQKYGVNQQLEEFSKALAFNSRRHSRDNEAEADLEAFNFMKKTGYDCNAIKTSLQLLDKIDDSSLYKPLDLQQVFNFKDYPFKSKWIQKESSIFSQLDENDSPLSQKEKDSLKTHPDCSKRILLLTDSLQKITKPGKNFLVDENLFNKLKKDFFVEITEQCYRSNNLSRNLYYSLLQVQANENIPMAVYSAARCLNQVYEDQKNHKLGLKIDSENKKYSADYNLLVRMLDRLHLDEIAALNTNFCKAYYQQMKDYPAFAEEIKKLSKLKN